MTQSDFIALIVVLAALVIAAITDVRDFKVPNLLTGPLLLLGLLYHAFSSGASGLAASAAGVLLGFSLTVPLYVLGGMGAGDVKLFAAVGAWLGPFATACLFLASSIAAGAYALAVVLLRGDLRATLGRLAALVRRPMALGLHGANVAAVEAEVRSPGRRRRLVPFAAVMAVSFVSLLLWARLQNNPVNQGWERSAPTSAVRGEP